MADSTWGVPLAGEAMWGEAPSGSTPPIPVNPSSAYLSFRVSIGEPPTISEVQVRPAQ